MAVIWWFSYFQIDFKDVIHTYIKQNIYVKKGGNKFTEVRACSAAVQLPQNLPILSTPVAFYYHCLLGAFLLFARALNPSNASVGRLAVAILPVLLEYWDDSIESWRRGGGQVNIEFPPKISFILTHKVAQLGCKVGRRKC